MSGDADLNNMWNGATQDIANIDPAAENWKIQSLPLARVKKIMKSEEIIMQELERERLRRERAEGVTENQERTNVKFMISGEAPVLMSKACELLIKDLSFRAWQHTERNRRRTLQRQDLHAAVGESEVYDFLIDIVPRVQAAAQVPPPAATPPAPTTTMSAPDMTMMHATLPPGFQVPQMAQVTAANLGQATMQQAHAMAPAVPAAAPPPPPPPTAAVAAPVTVVQQQAPAPAIPAGLDVTSTTPPAAPAAVIQYAQAVPTDALNHLVQWDPSQLTFPTQVPAEGADLQAAAAAAVATAAANPVPGSAPPPAPQHHHQQPAAVVQHTQPLQVTVPQPLHQPQPLQQPAVVVHHPQIHQQAQPQPQPGHQPAPVAAPAHTHAPAPQALVHAQPQQVQVQVHAQAPQAPPHQQHQQPLQQQQIQVPQQTTHHQQWMDPATLAAMGAASAAASAPPPPPAQQAPGV